MEAWHRKPIACNSGVALLGSSICPWDVSQLCGLLGNSGLFRDGEVYPMLRSKSMDKKDLSSLCFVKKKISHILQLTAGE